MSAHPPLANVGPRLAELRADAVLEAKLGDLHLALDEARRLALRKHRRRRVTLVIEVDEAGRVDADESFVERARL